MQSVNRLITEFKPKHYNLSLIIDRENRSFDGTVVITGWSSSGKIYLHAKDLSINKIVVNGHAGTAKKLDNDEIEITTEKQMAGEYTITIAYKGKITDSLHGLYPCYYKLDDEPHELLMTQFESHHAREVFPCVDEPEAKATFDICLTTEQGVAVLGNMPIKSEALSDNQKITIFETTPVMSTYLVAFVIGNLHKTTGATKDGVEVSVWSTPAQPIESHAFALEHAIKSIEFFNDYFGTPYPLPKSDQVAVPDFSSGAMENWGLVTYRESALLANPKTTPLSNKQYIAAVISHELSHQWFGNLVTMKWWDELWLNESFATLMEYIAVDSIYPDWQIWREFSSSEASTATRRDAIHGVQSVQIEVHHPDEISSIFDGAIVYAKGARLLRMLQLFVGEKDFRAGLKEYFKKHAYKNTTGSDLWKELAKTSGKEITNFMNAWITQPGFPVVSVKTLDGAVELSQKRFFVGPHDTDSSLWPIPLDANIELGTNILDKVKIDAKLTNSDKPLFLNSKNGSHFVTNYDEQLSVKIEELLSKKKIDISLRTQYVQEQSLLARGGIVPSAKLIDLLQYAEFESDEKIWTAFGNITSELIKFTDIDSPEEKSLAKLVGKVSLPEFDRLGWHPKISESEDDTMLRGKIIANMIFAEDSKAIGEAKKIFESTDLDAIDPDMRGSIISAVVRHHETKELNDRLLDIYQTSSLPDIKMDIMWGLTDSKNPETLGRLLGLLTDKNMIRSQDLLYWFVGLLRNRRSRDHAWEWLRNNWSWIEKTFGGDKSYDYFPRYAGSILSTRQQLEEYTKFFGPMKKVPSLKRTIEMGVIDIASRVELIESQKSDVVSRLNNL